MSGGFRQKRALSQPYRQLSLSDDEDKREARKDITALANAFGGYLIYGIEEFEDKKLGTFAGKLCPITDRDLPDNLTRLIVNTISPRCVFRSKASTDSGPNRSPNPE